MLKRCTGCKKEKPLDAFHLHHTGKFGRNPRCKQCRAEADQTKARERARNWHHKNRERARRTARAAYLANQKQRKASAKKWRKANVERKRENDRRWREQNRERANAHKALYRARKTAAFVEIVDRMKVYERDHGLCGICGRRVKKPGFAIDHIIPLSKGGDHSYANVQLAHMSCNSRKGNRA